MDKNIFLVPTIPKKYAISKKTMGSLRMEVMTRMTLLADA